MANLIFRMGAAMWVLAVYAVSAAAQPRPTSPPDQNAPAQFDFAGADQGSNIKRAPGSL